MERKTAFIEDRLLGMVLPPFLFFFYGEPNPGKQLNPVLKGGAYPPRAKSRPKELTLVLKGGA